MLDITWAMAKGWKLPAGSGRPEFGRRDWTRTNDPHHVKVVL